MFHASELEINPSDWDATRQEIKAKVLYDAEKRATFNKAVADRKSMMLEIYNAAMVKEDLTSDWLELEIDKRLHPEKYIIEEHRQTFFVYKQVKDPNLVGALSGHKEGSRAFARYRDIDEEMKNELVKMLE